MPRFLTALLVALLTLLPAVGNAQRTLEHPSKVRIVPATAADDSLYLFGGLTTQWGVIINADGTLNGGITPGAGTVTFSMWDDNGCSMGEVPVFSGVVWQCGTVGGGGFTGFADGSAPTPGGYFASDADTGLFRPGTDIIAMATGGVERARLDAAGRLGIGASSVQQKLHLYEASGQAAMRIERGDQETWDITVNTNLEFHDVEGIVTPLTLKATSGFVGILNTSPTVALDVTGAVSLSGNLTVGGSISNSLYPTTDDTYNLGSTTKAWAQAFISQLNTVLFAENTVQLSDGWQIIGKGAGRFNTAVLSAATTIDFGESLGSVPQWVLVKSRTTAGVATTEYILVSSLSSGTTYNVTRDVTSLNSPDPAWPDGTPWLLLGTTGDGRIQLYASSGVPQITVQLQGASAATATDIVRIGGLDGITGGGTGNYGLFVGDANESLLYFGGNLTLTGDVKANSGWFGTSGNHVDVDANGINVGSTGRITSGSSVTYSTGTGFFLGYTGGLPAFRIGSTSQYARWTGTAFEIAGGTLSAPTIDAGTIKAGASAFGTGTGYWLAYNAGAPQFRVGDPTDDYISWDGAGSLVVVSEALTINSSGIRLTPNTVADVNRAYAYDSAMSRTYEPGLYYYESGGAGADDGSIEIDNIGLSQSGTLSVTTTANNALSVSTVQAVAGETSNGTFTRVVASWTSASPWQSLIDVAQTVRLYTPVAVAFNDNGAFGDVLMIRTDNSATSPGVPWLRSNGNDLTINPDTGAVLYLARDAGSAVAITPSLFASSIFPNATSTYSLGDASAKWNDIYFSEPTTSTAGLFPVVSNNGRLMVKNTLKNGSFAIAGCTITVEHGLIKSATGAC